MPTNATNAVDVLSLVVLAALFLWRVRIGRWVRTGRWS